MDSKIEVKVNNTKIAMNVFVRKLFIKVIQGMIDSLDKIPEDIKKIEVVIEK